MRLPSAESSSTDTPTTSTPDRTLRLITLIAFPLAIPFAIPYAALAQQLCPALGLTPLLISAFLSLLLLCGIASGPRVSSLRILVDLLCALFLLGVLIPGWVVLARGQARRWYGNVESNVTMLGTYATVPMMVAFLIHAYIAPRDLIRYLRQPSTTPTCPHCHGDLSRSSAHPSYHSVHGHDSDEEAQVQVQQETGVATPSTTNPGSSKPDMLEIREPKPESSDMPRVSGDYRDSCEEDESAPLL
ncbi:hypothetical protein LTR86_001380 [Recurvomyces mirabilis]|nr:hypothetical protein LTR86_001380 [Recurvomyces mirabilis]